MFKEKVTQTPLTTLEANAFMQNISTNSFFEGDVTFMSTMRALLKSRAGDNVCRLWFGTYSLRTMSYIGPESLTNSLGEPQFDEIALMDFTSTDEVRDAWVNWLKKHFAEYYEGYKMLDKVELFFKKKMPVLCFINAERKSTVLLTFGLNMREYHYLQCGIPAFLPWYFDPEVGLTEQERALIESLRGNSPQAYLDAVKKIAESMDLREQFLRSQLSGFESAAERRRLETLKEDSIAIARQIRDLNDTIRRLFADQNEKDILILGLEAKIGSSGDGGEMLEYFLANKKLDLVSASNNGVIRFICSDYLEYADETQAQKYLSNRGSYFFTSGRGVGAHAIPDDDIEQVFEAIFINHILKVRFCSCYEIRMGGGVAPIGGYSFGDNYRTYMPNPHIQGYRCMGNYVAMINDYIAANDYISAVEGCVSSNKSLNLGDGIVMRSFVETILGESGILRPQCIELPDGRIVDIVAASKYLKETETEE